MTTFDQLYTAQGQRCWLCGYLMDWRNATFDHLTPRLGKVHRRRRRNDCLLSHKSCNQSRGGTTIGSVRFNKFLRYIMAGVDVTEAGHRCRQRRRTAQARQIVVDGES